MRIARFSTPEGEPRYGVVEGEAGSEVLAEIEGDPLYRPIQFTGDRHPLAEVRLLAPVIPRSKIVGVGRNYADHAAEMGAQPPAEPILFIKPNTAVIGPNDGISYPPASAEVHYEGELAVVIGRICRDVPLDRTGEVIFGYTCGNDVTARDLQRRDGQWARAKGFDTFAPLGPWIETEFDPTDQGLTTSLNGTPRQHGRTKDLIFSVPHLINYISQAFTLLPGDVIFTGTPAGVGSMRPGDEVSVSIDGIGTLTNRVISRG
ncbi:MAG: fumarylacetoacetate hydrolase family protein [Sporichthyaceae bacterium]|nr:fumarylacetoacetate hydrolase family protein [Sporichthyaceae bacterium]